MRLQHRSVHIRLVLVVSAWLALAASPTAANDLNAADDRGLQELALRAHALADDLAAASRPRNAGHVEQASQDEAATRQDCLLRLAGNLDSIRTGLDRLSGLVGVAARLPDETELPLLHRVLIADASGFLKMLSLRQAVLDLIPQHCTQEPTAWARSRDILRLYGDSASLVQLVIAKLGASQLSR